MNPSDQDYAINSLLFNEAQLILFQEILLTRDYWDEHQLLKHSFAQLQRELPNFSDSLSLFQGHFVVFNALYRLIASQQCPKHLALTLTRIELLPTGTGQAPPLNQDLMNYYLDEENLINTSRSMLTTMLENWGLEFAEYLSTEQRTQLNQSHRYKPIPHK